MASAVVVSYLALQNKLGGEFLKEKEVSHQLSGEPEMRFVSTALVMMAIALILLALMPLTPIVRANPMTFVANLAGANESPSNNPALTTLYAFDPIEVNGDDLRHP